MANVPATLTKSSPLSISQEKNGCPLGLSWVLKLVSVSCRPESNRSRSLVKRIEWVNSLPPCGKSSPYRPALSQRLGHLQRTPVHFICPGLGGRTACFETLHFIFALSTSSFLGGRKSPKTGSPFLNNPGIPSNNAHSEVGLTNKPMYVLKY